MAQEGGMKDMPPCVELEVERLPDMHVARSEHSFFYVNGEVVAAGGHTTGFIPTPTAEYFRDGEWHEMQMFYSHDHGFSVPLSSGKVLIAGGHKDNLGIGQSFEAELYDPVAHQFEVFGCLDSKRVMAEGLEVDSGQVLVSGNWYAKDGIELFDGRKTFSFVKETDVERAGPYLLRASSDDVLVLGGFDPKGNIIFSPVVTRWRGEPFTVPLLEQWQPVPFAFDRHIDQSFVGDKDKGDYAYLLLMHDKDDSLAIGLVRGVDFSLLPTSCPIPKKSPWGKDIVFFSSVVVDSVARRGYVVGIDIDYRLYVLGIDYARALRDTTAKASLTLYYSRPQADPVWCVPVLTDVGDLVLAGGSTKRANGSLVCDNFTPSSAAFLLRLGRQHAIKGAWKGWTWLIVALCLATLGGVGFLTFRHRREVVPSDGLESSADMEFSALRERIEQIMREEALYLNPQFKLNDLVQRLCSNRNYVYQAINVEMGMSFAEYVNRLRAEHAVRLMHENAEMPLSEVGMKSGFASSVSLYRYFKAIYGCSPKEYRERMNKKTR